MEPTIVQSGMVSGELAAKVKLAFAMALLERSEIDPAVLDLEGMSGRKYRHFVNNLIRSLANASYLEVGIWRGSTLCAAISRNDVQATAIDDWSQYGRARDEFHANLDRFRSPGARVTVIECDYRNINFYKIGRHLVYLFDGPHTFDNQCDGIILGSRAMEKEAILIIDDWNWEVVREATYNAISELCLSILYKVEVRSTLDNTHPDIFGPASDWHNGCLIAVVRQI